MRFWLVSSLLALPLRPQSALLDRAAPRVKFDVHPDHKRRPPYLGAAHSLTSSLPPVCSTSIVSRFRLASPSS